MRDNCTTRRPSPDRRRVFFILIAGIDTLDSQEGGGLEEEIAQAERDLRDIQMEKDRAIRLFVSGKITEKQLDRQRKFIMERLERAGRS